MTKTKQRFRPKVWWAEIDREVEVKCKSCHVCQLVGLPSLPEPLKQTEFSGDLAAGLMDPLPSKEYVFVVDRLL